LFPAGFRLTFSATRNITNRIFGSQALDINDRGQLTGLNENGTGFVASPVVPADVSVGSRRMPASGGGILLVTVELSPELSVNQISRIAIEAINGQPVAGAAGQGQGESFTRSLPSLSAPIEPSSARRFSAVTR
jgi:hypothetical protein